MTTETKFSLKIPNSQIYNLIEQNSLNNSGATANYSELITQGGTPYSISGVNISNHLTLDNSNIPSFTFSLIGNRTGVDNAGSDIGITSYDDQGEIKSTSLIIRRSNDNVILNGPLKLLSLDNNVDGNLTSAQFSLNLQASDTLSPFPQGNYGTVVRIGDVVTINCVFSTSSIVEYAAASYSIFFIKPIEATSPTIYGFNGSVKNFAEGIPRIPRITSVENVLNNQFEIIYIPPAGVIVNQGNTLEFSCSFSYTIHSN